MAYTKPGPKATPLEARFWPKVAKAGPDDCWNWTGCLYPNGYGLLRRTDGSGSAHRIAYELAYGPIPAGLYICHKCDNRRCVNPAHLFAGTPLDNSRDKITKHRHAAQLDPIRSGLRVTWAQLHPPGTDNPHAKLRPIDVHIIRAASKGGLPNHRIAECFGVSARLISDIVRRKVWRSVPEHPEKKPWLKHNRNTPSTTSAA